MEFQIAEAIELIKTLAETENLTKTQALTAFVAEAGLDLEYASALKAALFEEYTLQEMASDSMTRALYSVFVAGESGAEDIQEVDTKETQEGTKYKVRVKDKASGSSYVRYATREKVAELRANPNIASVEMTDYGSTGEDDRGERTAAAKSGRDYDGDGKKESSSKEHAGVVHNAIQRKMGGKPDGQDTRKEEFASEAMQHRDAKTGEVTDKPEVGKTYYPHGERQKSSVALRKEKEAAAKKKELGEERAKTREEARAKLEANKKAIESGKPEESPYGAHLKKKGNDPWSTHASDAKAHKKEDQKEEWKPDPKEKREKKAKALYDREQIATAQKGTKYETPKTEDPDKLYKRRQAIQSKNKMRKEDFVMEADLVDAGRENQSQRDRKKLDGKDVDNSRNVVLMPKMDESVVTEHEVTSSQKRLSESPKNEELRSRIKSLVSEECCPKCGTPECTCESKKEEKPKKKKMKIDEAGMPIMETEQESRNNARPGPSKEMIDPPADPQGDVGHMNPKGLPKRYKNKGEAPGDRRPNDPSGPDLPNEKGTVPNGAGV